MTNYEKFIDEDNQGATYNENDRATMGKSLKKNIILTPQSAMKAMKKDKTFLMMIALLEVIYGIAGIGLTTVKIIFGSGNIDEKAIEMFTQSYPGVWAGIWFIFDGILGICMSKSSKNGAVNTKRVTCVLAAVVSFVGTVLIGMVTPYTRGLDLALNIAICALLLSGLIVSVIQSVYLGETFQNNPYKRVEDYVRDQLIWNTGNLEDSIVVIKMSEKSDDLESVSTISESRQNGDNKSKMPKRLIKDENDVIPQLAQEYTGKENSHELPLSLSVVAPPVYNEIN